MEDLIHTITDLLMLLGIVVWLTLVFLELRNRRKGR